MRNAANKMTNPIDSYTENHFLSFIEISERNGSLCGSHSGSLWLSLAQKALARLATSQLRSISLFHSGTDMWFSAFKFSHDSSRPATQSFCHYPTWSRPEVKNRYPSDSEYDCVKIGTLGHLWDLRAHLLMSKSSLMDNFCCGLFHGILWIIWIIWVVNWIWVFFVCWSVARLEGKWGWQINYLLWTPTLTIMSLRPKKEWSGYIFNWKMCIA